MTISGETIRQTALEREKECPEAMKGSFYYGFREGAKWMQHENPLLKDVTEGKAIIVDAFWLKNHDKEMIWKACNYIMTHSTYAVQPEVYAEGLKEAMEN